MGTSPYPLLSVGTGAASIHRPPASSVHLLSLALCRVASLVLTLHRPDRLRPSLTLGVRPLQLGTYTTVPCIRTCTLVNIASGTSTTVYQGGNVVKTVYMSPTGVGVCGCANGTVAVLDCTAAPPCIRHRLLAGNSGITIIMMDEGMGSKSYPRSHADADSAGQPTNQSPVSCGLCLVGSENRSVYLLDLQLGCIVDRWTPQSRCVALQRPSPAFCAPEKGLVPE